VKTLVIFINELSLASSLSPEGMLPHVLSTLSAVRAVRRIRRDLVVAGQVPLGSVLLGDGTLPMAAVLRGDTHRDEWRFLGILDQSSPWDAHPDPTRPGGFQEVAFQGRTGVGMLWAKQNGSTILSFAFLPDWRESHVRADFREMDDAGLINSTEAIIPNLSNPEHVRVHQGLIESYGRATSSSTLIYEGDGFVVRIWFNDHPPPHFHVLMRRDTSESLARFAIETLDLLSGSVSPSIRRRVQEWARDRREELMRNWERCANRRLPFLMED
jgi:hypothetical protein